MRIVQEPAIDHDIRPLRQATLIAERLNGEANGLCGQLGVARLHRLAQLMRAEFGGVNQHIRMGAQPGQQRQLAVNALGGVFLPRHRVAAAGFIVTPAQHLCAAIQIEQLCRGVGNGARDLHRGAQRLR